MKLNKTATMLMCLSMVTASLIRPAQVRAAVTDADKQFLAMVEQANINEIKLSKLAEVKASNPDVKAFASKMVAEHTNLSENMKPFATAWGITPPTDFDADHQAVFEKLNSLSGADFDKAYMDAMDADHHKALEAFTQEADTTTDPKFKAAVMKGKSEVAAHTSMADALKAKL